MELAKRREGVTPSYLFLAERVLNEGPLQDLSNFSTDSFDYEDILRTTIRNLYESLPNGKENYFGKYSKIGEICLDRCHAPGFARLGLYISLGGGWRTEEIAAINIRERTYAIPKYNGLSEMLIEDTDKVMGILGLTKIEHDNKTRPVRHF